MTVAVLVCGLLLCCVYVLSNKICLIEVIYMDNPIVNPIWFYLADTIPNIRYVFIAVGFCLFILSIGQIDNNKVFQKIVVGGFLALVLVAKKAKWTDVVQGIMMLTAITVFTIGIIKMLGSK